MELSITWINRILFLKLLEAQLIRYHKGDPAFVFLNFEKVQNFDDLNTLFFGVLARRPADRSEDVRKLYANVPYLNSSLFEPTPVEHSCLFISQLKDGKLPIISSTVLKDNNGKKFRGELVTLEYLFKFLDAYDFASEGSEEIQEENKTLINASVLGLIFEKINGYKDGSFFTPGFITMYMCRETIRRAVVQKFNDLKGWNCEDLKGLYDKIDDRSEANEIINQLKICDPAVGSGHFLVSALNEIIAIKSELKILSDQEGKRLKEYHVEVVNDELIITDEDGKLFEYNPNSPESQRVQETLFREKQTIIENCLFGVDINPNSVKICRLRLWIELLKNAYYKAPHSSAFSNAPHSSAFSNAPHPPTPSPEGEGEFELETLPNIDINIKCGNSLISRYALDADIKQALKNSKWSIEIYRMAIMAYRNASGKDQKWEMERLIASIKSDFETEVAANDKRLIQLKKLNGELFNLTNQTTLFEKSKKELADWNKKVNDLTARIRKLETELEEIKNNKIYENAFEWRFEFPEVLNDEGDFIGFDVVIGNPPYIRQEHLGDFKDYLKDNYQVFSGTGDLFSYFYELSLNLLAKKGLFCFINNTFDKTNAGKILRDYIQNKYSILQYIDFTSVIVFEEATTYPIIMLIKNEIPKNTEIGFLKIESKTFKTNTEKIFNDHQFIKVSQKGLDSNAWNFNNQLESDLLNKFLTHKTIKDQYGKCYRGIVTGFNEAFILNKQQKEELIRDNYKENELIKPFLEGKDLTKWRTPEFEKWIIFTRRGTDIENFPAIKAHLEKYRESLTPKKITTEKAGRKPGPYKWYEIQDSVEYFTLFEAPKIVWPNLQNKNKFLFDEDGRYINAPGVIFPTEELYLLAFLNSPIVWYFLTNICVVRNGGFIEVKPQYFEQIPIPEISDETKIILTEKVNQILAFKKTDTNADTSVLEKEIDRLVYELYGLTEEEIKIIEQS